MLDSWVLKVWMDVLVQVVPNGAIGLDDLDDLFSMRLIAEPDRRASDIRRQLKTAIPAASMTLGVPYQPVSTDETPAGYISECSGPTREGFTHDDPDRFTTFGDSRLCTHHSIAVAVRLKNLGL